MKDRLALKVVIIVVAAVLVGFLGAVLIVGFPASPESTPGKIGSGLNLE